MVQLKLTFATALCNSTTFFLMWQLALADVAALCSYDAATLFLWKLITIPLLPSMMMEFTLFIWQQKLNVVAACLID